MLSRPILSRCRPRRSGLWVAALLSTTIACDSGSSPGDSAGAGGSEEAGDGPGGGESLDPARLDREAEGECGYWGPGPEGYGTEVGQRLADFTLIDCNGDEVRFSDFLCPREDGTENRAYLVSIGAGWCEPCKEEIANIMPELYEPMHPRGLEIVNVMFQDDMSDPPTTRWCREEWIANEEFVGPLEFPVLLDQVGDFWGEFIANPQTATPVNLLVDANGNIRWKLVGQKPTGTAAQVELLFADPYGQR